MTETIREANISQVLPGMERDALLLAQKRIDYLLELNDTLIAALESVNPMTGTSHKGECPACHVHIELRAHRFGCKIGSAIEAYKGMDEPKPVGKGMRTMFFD